MPTDSKPPPRAPLRIETLEAILAQPIENEIGILELLLAQAGKGQAHAEIWEKLHEAARRDDRLSELAFAYERIVQDKKLKALPPPMQADIWMHVGTFFADVFGDVEGAQSYLERALALQPAHPDAFVRLEHLFEGRGDSLKLSDLYATAAAHRGEKVEQVRLLKRAVELRSAAAGEEERVVKLCQQILKVEPSDSDTRQVLVARYAKASRHSDLAKLLEQSLGADPAPPEGEAFEMRAQLVGLYARELREIERATPHMEEVLRRDGAHTLGRKVAEELLTHKAVATRAAFALEGAYERTGALADAARMLALQIEQVRGPKRVEAQKRLAVLREDRLNDAAAALALYEQIVAVEPGDEDVRARFIALAGRLDKRADAARVLQRALTGAKDVGLRARVGVEIGETLLAIGDPKRARSVLQTVLEGGGDDTAVLRAARALEPLAAEARDLKVLATVLEKLGSVDPDESRRAEATKSLALLCEGELKDPDRAIASYRRLLATPLEDEALHALERLYETTGAHEDLAVTLERLAVRADDTAVGRAIAFRAADVRTTKLPSRADAIDAWKRLIEAHGAARDVFARLLPLLEQEKRWEELASTIEADAALAPAVERAAALARLANVRMTRLGDGAGAMETYGRALAIDPAERATRLALEKLLASGDLRLRAAELLEPIYRAENAPAGLLKVLDARASLVSEVGPRLSALREAALIAERDVKDPRRALEFVGRGIEEAVKGALGDLPVWLAHFDDLAPASGDARRRSEVLVKALADREVTDPALAELARRAAQSLEVSGDVAAALAIYRRALAFEPSSAELLSRVDALLREQGSPEERLALYRAALEQPSSPSRRREILHAIGAIERRDLGDLRAAVATYRIALGEDPSDRVAYEALLDAHAAAGAWDDLDAELAGGLGRARGDERAMLLLRIARLAVSRGVVERAVAPYREVLAARQHGEHGEVLDEIETLADIAEDATLLRDVLERRVELAADPTEEATSLERLGVLLADKLADPAAAIKALRRGAELAETAGDAARAMRLYERVLVSSPEDTGAATRLCELYKVAGTWDWLPAAYAVLLRAAKGEGEATDLVLALEAPAVQAHAIDAFLAVAREVLGRGPSPERATALLAAKARVLASDPGRQDGAASAYRAVIEGAGDEWIAAADAFSTFLATRPERHADQRFLLVLRAERATESDRVRALLAWAAYEETTIAAPAAAAEVHARVLAIEPDNDDALAARARLLLALGDAEGAAAAIAARRDRSDGAARIALDLELGALLLDRLERPAEALDAVAGVLEASPTDAAAIRIAHGALAHASSRRRAAALLERAAEAIEDPAARAELLEVLLSAPHDDAELAPSRRAWFESLLEILEGNKERALEIALRAVRELPHEPSLWERTEALARELARPDPVAAAYRAAIAGPTAALREPERMEEIGRRAVDYQEEWFDEADAVVTLLRSVLEIAPAASWAFDRLKLVYNAGERWTELLALYDGALARALDQPTRAEILEDAAQIAKDFAGAPERSIRYLEELQRIKKGDSRVRASLERLYERYGHHRPLIELLDGQLAALEGEALQKQRLRIAGLWLEGAHDVKSAFGVVEQILEVDPERAEAFELIEKIVTVEPPSLRGSDSIPPPSRKAPSVRARAAALLETRYRARGQTEDLVRVLAIELETASGKKDRGRRLRELAKLRVEELSDEVGALEDIAALVALDPVAEEPRRELARLAQRTGRHARHAEVLTEIAAIAKDGARKVDLLGTAARIHAEQLADPSRAIEVWREVFAAAAFDPKVQLEPARELSTLLASAARDAERCEVLERLGEIEPDQAARFRALGEAARIASSVLVDRPRAVRAHRRRLDEDAKDREALDGLVSELDQMNAFRDLTVALASRALLGAPAEARRDRVAIARVLGDRLGEHDEAIAAWVALRSDLGADEESCDALAALLERTGRDAELIALYEREASATTVPQRGAAMWRRAGDFHRQKGALDLATLSYEAALEADVTDEAAQSGLEAVLEALIQAGHGGREELARVVGALARVYTANKDDTRLIALLEPRLTTTTGELERAQILAETAELLEAHGDSAAAFEVLWRAFAITPADEIIAEGVIRTASAASRWEVVALSLASIFEARRDVPADIARMLFWHVGLFFRDERRDPDAAEQALERALAFGEGDVLILRALADLRRRSRDRTLVSTLIRLADATEGDLDLYREAAETAADHVRDRALALSIGEKLFDLAVVRWASGVHDVEVETEAERALFSTGAWTATDLEQTTSGLGQDAPGAITWALEFLIKTAREDAERDRVVGLLLRGSELPFGEMKRRAIRLSSADLAEPERALSIYRDLFKLDPTDEMVGGRLEGAYRAAGRLRDLAELRQVQVGVATTIARKVELRFDAALFLAEIGEADNAIAALAQNLEELPTHALSVARLASLYEAKGLSAELAALWEEQAQKRDAAGDRESAAALWLSAAELAESLGDAARAIRGYRRAAAMDAPVALDRLARLHVARGEHASAAEVLERLLARANPAEIPPVALLLADSYAMIGDVERARERLEQALTVAPESPAIAARLADLYRKAQAWGPLAALVAKSAEDAPDRATRLARLREAAELHLVRRGDPASAIPLLEQAAALAPEDLGVRLITCDAMSAAGRFDDAAGILRGMIESYGQRRPKERALVHHQLARLSLAEGDRARALGELDAAVKIDPAHPAILHALARLALEEGQLERAERSFRGLLLVIRRATREGSTGGIGRAEVLLELSAIAERQGEAERAVELVESAFEEARDSDSEMEELVRVLRASDKHSALARALELRLGLHADGADAAAVLHELATVYEDHLGRSEAALDARLRALSLSPDAQPLHEAALALTRRTGGLEKYLATVTQLVEKSTEPRRAAKLLFYLGRALESEVHDDAQAATTYLRAEELLGDEDDGPSALLPDVWRALERVHRRSGDGAAEARVLEKRIARVPALTGRGEGEHAERAEGLYRLAEIRLARPADRDSGVALLEEASDMDPDAARAEANLRASIEITKDERLIRLFEAFARRTDRGRALVDALVLLADSVAEGSPARLEEAARTATALGDRALAESLLRRVLHQSSRASIPDTGGAELVNAVIALADLRFGDGDLAEAADLKERAAKLVDPAEERKLLLEVARLAAGPLKDAERAIRIYEDLRAREPAEREVWEPLADVYRSLGDAKRLGTLLDETAPLVDALEERVGLHLERAMISMREDPALAMSLFRDILEEDPSQLHAGMLLSGMLEARGETGELATLLARQLDHAKDREDKASVISLSTRLGALLEQQNDVDGALDVYHGALDWDASAREALKAIVRLSLKRDDSMDLGDALGKLLEVEEGQEAVDLALQLAEIRAGHGDEPGAENAIAMGYKACPSSELLRDELVRRYSAREAFGELAGVHLLDASVRKSLAEQVECLRRAADILRERAGDARGAADILRRALAASPSDREVLSALVDAYGALGEHGRAIEAIGAALEGAADDAWLYRSRAALHHATGDLDLSLADLEVAHGKSNGGYAGELVAELEAALTAGGVPGRTERDLRLELAEVLVKSGDAEKARAHLSDLVKRDGKDRAALRALASLEETEQRWDAVSVTLRRLLALEDGDALVATALKLATACERADRFADARAGLERALKIAPANLEVRDLLRKVYNVTGASRELAGMILEDARAAADVQGRFTHLLHAGRLLFEENAEDAPQAIVVLEEARSLRPEEQEATLLLAQAYAAAGRRAEATTLLDEAVASHKGRRSKPLSLVYQCIAGIEEVADRAPLALAALQKAFESDPHSGALAMRLGVLAVSLGDREVAARVFRSLTLMKPAAPGSVDGATPAAKSVAYYHLGRIAEEQGDRRKARLMMEKAVAEDPTFAPARALLDELRGA